MGERWRGKVRGMVSTWHSVGPGGNYPGGQSEGLGTPETKEGMRMKGQSPCHGSPAECDWGWEEMTKREKGPSTSGPEPLAVRASRPERAPRSCPASASGLTLDAAKSFGPGAGRGRQGRRDTWGHWLRVRRGRRPRALWSGPVPPGSPSLPAARRPVHALANWAKWGAGGLEGGAPAQQLQPPSPRPQSFTKRRVRPHQSPLIIVGWAAGGGRGPGPAGRAAGNGLCGGSESRARRRRAEGGSEA